MHQYHLIKLAHTSSLCKIEWGSELRRVASQVKDRLIFKQRPPQAASDQSAKHLTFQEKILSSGPETDMKPQWYEKCFDIIDTQQSKDESEAMLIKN